MDPNVIGSLKVIAAISTPGLECRSPGLNPGDRRLAGRQGLRAAGRTLKGLKVAARVVDRRLPGADRRLPGAGRRLPGADRRLSGAGRRLPGAREVDTRPTGVRVACKEIVPRAA